MSLFCDRVCDTSNLSSTFRWHDGHSCRTPSKYTSPAALLYASKFICLAGESKVRVVTANEVDEAVDCEVAWRGVRTGDASSANVGAALAFGAAPSP